MPGVKISSLPSATLGASDIIPAARGGTTVGVNASQILNRFTKIETDVIAISGRTIHPRNSSTINMSFNTTTREISSDLGPYLDLSGRTVVLPPVIAIPPGAVMPFVGQNAPVGWLVCDGSLVPNGNGTVQGKSYNFGPLHTALGTTYGPEVGGQRKLPDLRGYFVRGFGSNEDATSSGVFGQKQADAFQGHKHGLHDPQHGHTASTNLTGAHDHKTFGSGTLPTYLEDGGSENPWGSGNSASFEQTYNVNDSAINTCKTSSDGNHSHTVSIVANSTNVKVLSPTGDQATAGAEDSNGPGGATPRTSHETRPANIAMLYCVKY
jgi:microcystin-dependent protein